MEAFYAQILFVHVAAVSLSGALFFTRAVASNVISSSWGSTWGAAWAMAAPVRYLSYSIDTTLLTAALMLMTITHQAPFVTDWLTVKIALLVVYIVLGSYALKRGHSRTVRRLCSLAAIAVLAFMATIALAHDPLGALSWLR